MMLTVRSIQQEGFLAEISGIIVPFGGPGDLDRKGNYWTRETDFRLGMWKQRPLILYHALRGVDEAVGFLLDDSYEVREEGLFARGLVYDTEAGQLFVREARAGRGFFSTSVLPTMYREEPDGFIPVWAFVEASLTDQPSATKARTRIALEQWMRQAGIDQAVSDEELVEMPAIPISEEHVNDPALPQPEAVSAPALAREEAQPAPVRRLAATNNDFLREAPRASVSSKYDKYSLGQLTFVAHVYQEAGAILRRPGLAARVDNEMLRALNDKARRAWAKESEAVQALVDARLHVQPWMRSIDEVAWQAWHTRVPFLRSDEAMQSDLANYGDELVLALFSSTAWHNFAMETRVLANLSGFAMPSNPYTWPTMGSGPTVRKVPELADEAQLTAAASNIPDSKVGTGAKTFNCPDGIGAMTPISTTLIEDSSVDIVAELYTAYARAMAEAIDYVLINGDDSATATNISHYGVDPTGTAYDKIMVMDGLRHIANDNSDSAATATIATTSALTLQKLMGDGGKIGLDIPNLAWFVDPGSYYKLLEVSTFDTVANMGPLATLLTGEIGKLRGVPVIPTTAIEKMNSSGQIPSAHNGTLGGQVLVHRPTCKVGIRRDIETMFEKVPGASGFVLSSTARMDLQVMEPGGCAFGYNTTI